MFLFVFSGRCVVNSLTRSGNIFMGRILRSGAKITSLQRQGQSLWKLSRDTSKARRQRSIKKEPTGNGSLKNYDAFIPRAFWERPGFSAWNSIIVKKFFVFPKKFIFWASFFYFLNLMMKLHNYSVLQKT